MDEHNNVEPRGKLNGHNNETAESETNERRLDIPVKSWDAYRDWCERVRDSWHEDQGDKPPQLFG